MGQIHDTEFDDYLIDSVTIDESAITDDYVRVAPDLAYWATKAADALRDEMLSKAGVEDAKGRIKEAEAKAWMAARASLEADPDIKKPLASHIDALASIQPVLLAAKAAHIAAMEDYAEMVGARKKVDGTVTAVATKREMLISLGATLRKEMAGAPPG